MVLSAPLFLFYYLTVGARHRLLWHGCLAGALAAGVGANLFWLLDGSTTGGFARRSPTWKPRC